MGTGAPGVGKRLIICCDGTWNTPSQEDHGLPAPTNVYKIYSAVIDSMRDRGHPTDKPQYCYYHTGVGTEGGLLSRLCGGLYGRGIDQNIKSAYHWLARHYEEGDEIYLFGFSRGAFTVRSLGGMLGRCGLLDLTDLGPDPLGGTRLPFDPDRQGDFQVPSQSLSGSELPDDPAAFNAAVKRSWKQVDALYRDLYRGGDYPWFMRLRSLLAKALLRRFGKRSEPASADETRRVPVKFVGVWDTVGSLGVPDDLRYFWFLSPPRRWKFHDTELVGLGEFEENPQKKSCVTVARQALAIDEVRSGFTPTRWQLKPGSRRARHTNIVQKWFPGVHADVGGGYSACGLSDSALDWIAREAHGLGLCFNADLMFQVEGDPQGPMHNPRKGMMKFMRTRPRAVPDISRYNPTTLHESASERHADPPITQSPYRPTVRIDESRPRASAIIYASQQWTDTGLYLTPGCYRFEAHGMWMQGGRHSCTAEGLGYLSIWQSTLKMIAQDCAGWVERLLRKFPGMARFKFPFTLRHTELDRFKLIGAVAERLDSPDPSGSPNEYKPLDIGQQVDAIRVSRPGYFYAYPNNAWMSYKKNRGSVTLTVERL